MSSGMHIGIDVGGTNTDAALMQGRKVVSTAKRSTTADVTHGAAEAIQAVLDQSAIAPEQITAVMVGTTHFVNAFVQRRDLSRIGIVRIGLPMGSGIPPLVDWPEELTAAIGENVFMVRGGSYYTGRTYVDLDEAELDRVARKIKALGLKAVAVSSVFAPIRPDLEEVAKDILLKHNPNMSITLSHTVGGIGLVERENAAAINAALFGLADQVVSALEEALANLQLSAKLYFSQNDGTLMGTGAAKQFPVMTCSAGPTNSIRGAAFLTGLDDAIVVDVGGTTSDVGVLLKGFARETIDSFDMGGVRTNFTMPDVLSVALGGGTKVKISENGEVSLGPESVGFRLLQEGRAFGGETLTTSDIAVLRGSLSIGDAGLLQDLDSSTVSAVAQTAHDMVDAAVDQLRTSATRVPVILVGGGSVIVDSDLACASTVVRPENGGVANAIGAAIAQVGGRTKRLYDFSANGGRDEALKHATAAATEKAVAAGALRETVSVVDIEEYPMTHMQTNTVDVRVRVAGDLNLDKASSC